MHPHCRAIFDTCETVFSLIHKGETWKDGYTTVKYKAPDLRKFSLVDEIVVGVRFVDDSLELIYTFKVKKIDATAHSLNFKKGKAEVTQTWSPQEYLFGGGFIRQEFVEKMLDEAFSVVATGFSELATLGGRPSSAATNPRVAKDFRFSQRGDRGRSPSLMLVPKMEGLGLFPTSSTDSPPPQAPQAPRIRY